MPMYYVKRKGKAQQQREVTIGVYNHCKEFRGLQIGLINKTQTLKGLQIGLININKSRKTFLFNWRSNED